MCYLFLSCHGEKQLTGRSGVAEVCDKPVKIKRSIKSMCFMVSPVAGVETVKTMSFMQSTGLGVVNRV